MYNYSYNNRSVHIDNKNKLFIHLSVLCKEKSDKCMLVWKNKSESEMFHVVNSLVFTMLVVTLQQMWWRLQHMWWRLQHMWGHNFHTKWYQNKTNKVDIIFAKSKTKLISIYDMRKATINMVIIDTKGVINKKVLNWIFEEISL